MMPDRLWPFAKGSEGTLILATAVWGTAVLLWFLFPNILMGILLFITTSLFLLILYFFRDPNRQVLQKPGLAVSPGDGEVVEIAHEVEHSFLKAESIRVSLFLNINDVHVQRNPLQGIVTLVEHTPGKFVQAFRPEASDINENITMMTETPYGTLLLKQIAGILARRCVNYAKPNQMLATGERFGLIRFGSRLDLFLPPSAKILVKLGDKVKGGLDPIAQLTPSEPE